MNIRRMWASWVAPLPDDGWQDLPVGMGGGRFFRHAECDLLPDPDEPNLYQYSADNGREGSLHADSLEQAQERALDIARLSPTDEEQELRDYGPRHARILAQAERKHAGKEYSPIDPVLAMKIDNRGEIKAWARRSGSPWADSYLDSGPDLILEEIQREINVDILRTIKNIQRAGMSSPELDDAKRKLERRVNS